MRGGLRPHLRRPRAVRRNHATALPEDLTPALLYLFVAAACYLVVPLTLTVEQLVAMTGQATRSATTLERLLDSASGT